MPLRANIPALANCNFACPVPISCLTHAFNSCTLHPSGHIHFASVLTGQRRRECYNGWRANLKSSGGWRGKRRGPQARCRQAHRGVFGATAADTMGILSVQVARSVRRKPAPGEARRGRRVLSRIYIPLTGRGTRRVAFGASRKPERAKGRKRSGGYVCDWWECCVIAIATTTTAIISTPVAICA